MSRRIRLLLAVVLSVVVASGVYRFRWGVLGLAGLGPPSRACEEVEALETYLRAGGSPSAYVGRMPLIMCATEAGSYEVVARLIELGVDVDAPKKGPYVPIVSAWDYKITALYVAVAEDRFEIAELLFKNGADASQTGPSSLYSPLDLTFNARSRSKYLRLFLNAKENVSKLDGSQITSAAFYGVIEVFEILIEEENIQLEEVYEQSLIEAASQGHIELVQFLANAGVSIDARHKDKRQTALHRSAASGELKVVKFLINAGASVNVTDDKGNTPLDYAIEYGHLEVVDILLESGASID